MLTNRCSPKTYTVFLLFIYLFRNLENVLCVHEDMIHCVRMGQMKRTKSAAAAEMKQLVCAGGQSSMF